MKFSAATSRDLLRETQESAGTSQTSLVGGGITSTRSSTDDCTDLCRVRCAGETVARGRAERRAAAVKVGDNALLITGQARAGMPICSNRRRILSGLLELEFDAGRLRSRSTAGGGGRRC